MFLKYLEEHHKRQGAALPDWVTGGETLKLNESFAFLLFNFLEPLNCIIITSPLVEVTFFPNFMVDFF